MKTWKVKINGYGTLVLNDKDLAALTEEVKALNNGESVQVIATEMTEDEYNKLPEHEGW
jgi:hypothetical protein